MQFCHNFDLVGMDDDCEIRLDGYVLKQEIEIYFLDEERIVEDHLEHGIP